MDSRRRKTTTNAGRNNETGDKARVGIVDAGGVAPADGRTDSANSREAGLGNPVSVKEGRSEDAPRVDVVNSAGATGRGRECGVGRSTADATYWQDRVRRLLGREGQARFEAGVMLIAEQAARLAQIADIAQVRFVDGEEVTLVKGDLVVSQTKYDPDNARVAIAAMDAIGKRVPIFVPDKVALTNPDGTEVYDGKSIEELRAAALALAGKGNAE